MPRYEVYIILLLIVIIALILKWTWNHRGYLMTSNKNIKLPPMNWVDRINTRKFGIALICFILVLLIAPVFIKIALILIGLFAILCLSLRFC